MELKIKIVLFPVAEGYEEWYKFVVFCVTDKMASGRGRLLVELALQNINEDDSDKNPRDASHSNNVRGIINISLLKVGNSKKNYI